MADVPLMTNPMTTAGDVIYGGASGAPTRLAVGTAGQVLKVNAGATAVEWGSAATFTGAVVSAGPAGVVYSGSSTLTWTSRADAVPISVPGTMYLRSIALRVSAAGSGTHQWGLFDYSSNAAAATKLAGGTGTLNSTGMLTIAATGAPVTINPGNYMLVFLGPSSNAAQLTYGSSASGNGAKTIASYVWDDTPDFTSTWSGTSALLPVRLVGDLVSGTQW